MFKKWMMYGLYVWIVVFLASGKGCKQVANIQKLVHLDGLDMFGFVGRNPLFFDFQGFPALESTWNLHRTENHEEEQLVDQPFANLHGQQVHRLLSWNNLEYVFFPCLMIYKEAQPHVIPPTTPFGFRSHDVAWQGQECQLKCRKPYSGLGAAWLPLDACPVTWSEGNKCNNGVHGYRWYRWSS